MIKLEINSLKELFVLATSKIYKGENMINSIQITATDNTIGEKRMADCELNLHVVLPDGDYIVYPVTWSENSIPLTGFVPITYDITARAQLLQLYVEILSGSTVIGKSNTVLLQVFDSPDEQTALTPREQLEETISELEEELESAETLTEMLEELAAGYESFPARIAADEAGISSNAADITTHSSAIVSLTAALNGKLDNTDGVVTKSKLSTELQDIIDGLPEDIVNLQPRGTLSAASALDSVSFCYAGAIYSFTADGNLAAALGVDALSKCELRFISGYQVVTDIATQKRIVREVYAAVPSFSASSWSEAVSPTVLSRITALESTVGTLNIQLENALNGGA